MPSAAEIQRYVIGELDTQRQMRGLGIRQFCDAANVGTATWYDWQALKTSPPLDDICRMAEVLQAYLDVGLVRYDAQAPQTEVGTMRQLSSLEAREVALLMERMTPEQRTYVRDVARAVGIPREPARER